jgi:hypothetical protein
MAAKVSNTFARYIKADSAYRQRIIAASQGEVGTGKTSFWLGAPGPIVILTLDQGLEGVVEQHASTGKEIYIADYDLGQTVGDEFTHAKAVEARDKFVEDFEHAIGHARTIVVDRETDMWNLFFFAEFGTDDAFAAAPPKDWDRLKGKIRRLISMAKASDVNLGLIRGMKNEWVQKVNPKSGAKAAAQSGNRVPAGMEEIDALVHITLEHTHKGQEFGLHVGKSRGPGGHEIQDQDFTNLTFKEFAMLVFPDSNESDWE